MLRVTTLFSEVLFNVSRSSEGPCVIFALLYLWLDSGYYNAESFKSSTSSEFIAFFNLSLFWLTKLPKPEHLFVFSDKLCGTLGLVLCCKVRGPEESLVKIYSNILRGIYSNSLPFICLVITLALLSALP